MLLLLLFLFLFLFLFLLRLCISRVYVCVTNTLYSLSLIIAIIHYTIYKKNITSKLNDDIILYTILLNILLAIYTHINISIKYIYCFLYTLSICILQYDIRHESYYICGSGTRWTSWVSTAWPWPWPLRRSGTARWRWCKTAGPTPRCGDGWDVAPWGCGDNLQSKNIFLWKMHESDRFIWVECDYTTIMGV